MNIIKDIDLVGLCYKTHENSFDELFHKYFEEVSQVQFSKSRYYYIYPFENELNGQKRGRLLKKKPSTLKNIYEYGFNHEKDLVYTIEHISSTIKKITIIEKDSEYITAFTYVGQSHRLQNVTRVFGNATTNISVVINWGIYGWRYDSFKYEDDLLVQIERVAHEHQSEKMTNSVFHLNYVDGQLDAIAQHFCNGYECKIYP